MLLFCSTTWSWAADANFAGTWRIDLERSDPMTQQGLKVDNSYQVTLQGEDLAVIRTFYSQGQSQSVDWTFVTDGKPHEIPGLRQSRTARTKWKKEKLTVSYTLSMDTPRGAFDLDVVETWSINKAGELEILYATRLPNRTQTRKEVFVRQAAGEG
jgi:hypothetical protein